MMDQLPSLSHMRSWLQTAAQTSRRRWAPDFEQSDNPVFAAAQAGTVISVVVIGVIALIGILIFAQINDALPSISNTELDDAAGGVTDGFANAMELVPIVLLVLVAALVISVVQRMRGGNMMGR